MSGGRGGRQGADRSAPPLDAWLAELELEPLARAERDGVASRDVLLQGRRRRDIRATLILDPGLGCLIWVHYAPPLADGFRKAYQRLLHWNDELPFVKFGLADEERITLSAELPLPGLERDTVGLALARLVAVCDLLAEGSSAWIRPGRPSEAASVAGPSPLMARYAAALGELWSTEPGAG